MTLKRPSVLQDERNAAGRRKFLSSALAMMAGTHFLTFLPGSVSALGPRGGWRSGGVNGGDDGLGSGLGDSLGSDGSSEESRGRSESSEGREAPPTIRQVIDLIMGEVPGAPFSETVDTIKSGNADLPVKGIVTTMFATNAVIENAARLGANFIIAHEPTFYNHADEVDWLESDPAYLHKKELLDRHGIVVWRCHDYLHAHRPDGVLMGVLMALGWDRYYNEGAPDIVTIPAISFGDMARLVKKQLGIRQLKVIGSLEQSCQRVVLSPGAAGGRSQIGLIRKYRPDVFICGELNEWETSEYIRDARYQGQSTSLIVLGHSVSEEPGMQWLVSWLQPKLSGVQVTHLSSGDPFGWV